MNDNDGSAIKLLVDALSQSLQNLSDKINSYQPILTQLGQNSNNEALELNKIMLSIENITKLLDTTVKDFYIRTDSLIKNVDEINTNLETFNKNFTTKSDNIIVQMNIANEEIEPISKFMKWISKPIGLLIFIIGMLIASFTITNCVSSAIDYFRTTKENVQNTENFIKAK